MKNWKGDPINSLPPYQEAVAFLNLTDAEYPLLWIAEERVLHIWCTPKTVPVRWFWGAPGNDLTGGSYIGMSNTCLAGFTNSKFII